MSNVRNALEHAVWLYERYGLIAGTIEGDRMAAGKWINAAREALAQSEATDIHKALEALLGNVMNFRHESFGMVRGGPYVRADALLEAAALAQPQAAQPGTPQARFLWIMRELEKRFPDPEPFSSSIPEARYFAALDAALAQAAQPTDFDTWRFKEETITSLENARTVYDEQRIVWNAARVTPPQPAPRAEPALLVRDVAEIMGMDSVMPICKALIELGYPPRSVNMAIAPDEAMAVAKHLAKPAAAPEPFQARMMAWLLACFGPEISGDKVERNHRFLEEALELVQACGCTADEAHQLVDYTYGRPLGEARQEVGGVVTTLSALCSAQGIDMHDAAEAELARIWTKIDVIRAKQAAKPKHSPLPMAGGEP